MFFFVVNIGALEKVAEGSGQGTVTDFRAFQLPVAIIFAVTGISRASALVTDIQNGYFDRLLMTPIRRLSLLLGLMIADFALVIALSIPVVVLGFIFGVRFETGLVGMLVFIFMAGLWGLAFTGFPYAIALKTGNPAAVNTSFILFFPFAFLTTSFLPQEALTGWLSTVADWNPVTYLLAGMRTLILTGWDADEILKGFAAIVGVGAVSMTLAFMALRGRSQARLTGVGHTVHLRPSLSLRGPARRAVGDAQPHRGVPGVVVVAAIVRRRRACTTARSPVASSGRRCRTCCAATCACSERWSPSSSTPWSAATWRGRPGSRSRPPATAAATPGWRGRSSCAIRCCGGSPGWADRR